MQGEYVKVYAASTYARDTGVVSGGEQTTYAHVTWTKEGGFTDYEWFTGTYSVYDQVTGKPYNAYGPTKDKTPEEIKTHIEQYGSLDKYFDEWEANVDTATRTGWIAYVRHEAPQCVDG